MSCAGQIIVQMGARVDAPVLFTDGLDGPAIAIDTLAITSAIKSSNGAAPVGIDPASIGATITQLQDDTPADIDGLAAVNFTSSLCQKGDVITINGTGTITATGATASFTKSFRIVDNPQDRLVAC